MPSQNTELTYFSSSWILLRSSDLSRLFSSTCQKKHVASLIPYLTRYDMKVATISFYQCEPTTATSRDEHESITQPKPKIPKRKSKYRVESVRSTGLKNKNFSLKWLQTVRFSFHKCIPSIYPNPTKQTKRA